MDEGRVPDGIQRLLEDVRRDRELQAQMNQLNASQHTPGQADAEMSDSPSWENTCPLYHNISV